MGMDSFPEAIQLRDFWGLIITPLQAEDSAALQDFYRRMPEEDRQFMRDDVISGDWPAYFQRKLGDQGIVSLVAKADNEVVGEATLYRTLHGWTRHVGELRVSVDPGLRKKGLGTALCSSLVKVATDLGIEKIIVHVVDNQGPARRTFEKLGFKKEAVLPHHVMDISGTKRDLLVLANDVDQIWAAMEVMNQDYAPHLT